MQIHKKGVGACSSVHPGTLGLRIASPHRIDNAVSPRQHELYNIKVYRYAPRRRLVVICLLWESRLRSSLTTTTDVRKRLSYTIRPPAYPSGLTSDGAKVVKRFVTTKETARIFVVWAWIVRSIVRSNGGNYTFKRRELCVNSLKIEKLKFCNEHKDSETQSLFL